MLFDSKKLPFDDPCSSGRLQKNDSACCISDTNSAAANTKVDSATPNRYSAICDEWERQNDKAARKSRYMGIQDDTKCKIVYEDGKISVLKNIGARFTRHLDIMSDIKSIKVYNDKHGNQKSMTMVFNNGVSVTASVDDMDVFSMDQGITICLLKYMLNRASEGCETSIYNKLVKHANRVYENGVREEEAAKEEAKRLEAKHKKLAAKKQRRKDRKREYEIELRKEAYIRAMNEMQNKPL